MRHSTVAVIVFRPFLLGLCCGGGLCGAALEHLLDEPKGLLQSEGDKRVSRWRVKLFVR